MNGNRLLSTWRLALRLFGAGLVLFHGHLLWQRWVDGSLVDFGVAAQWLASALLIVGLVLVRKRHGSLFRGREAAVVWILVALLHALAGVPTTQMLAAPVPWLAVPLGLLAVSALALILARTLRRTPRSPARGWSAMPPKAALAGHGGVLGSRAPPC
jgi:hypothetical protein